MERALSYKADWDAAALFDEYGIPGDLRGGLERYLKHGIRPGGFLQAVLRNDLVEAKLRAQDGLMFLSVYDVLTFLACEASGNVWGSPGNVERWISECSARRRANPEAQQALVDAAASVSQELAVEACDLACGEEFEGGAARCRHGRPESRAIRSAITAELGRRQNAEAGL